MKIIPGCCDVPLSASQYLYLHQGAYIDLRDCVCLSAPRGAIGEDGRIVSFQHAVQQRLRCGFVHIALRGCVVEHAVECERLVLRSLALRPYRGAAESLDGVVFWRVEYPDIILALSTSDDSSCPYKHFSSITLITGRMPFELILGVGRPASEPSPRNSVWSSLLVTCAASRMVKGRTRTVTEMEDAPAAAMVAP
jgi:hypothetical protein